MDSRWFDDLTKDLAGGASRRALLRGLVGVAAGLGLGRDALAQANKTSICHHTGSGVRVITVANNALPAHYAHGDFAYTDCCTDGECADGFTCTEGACAPVCADTDCPDDQACQNGACAPLACGPHLAPINHICQHPCANAKGHCNDPDALPVEDNCNCMSIVSGEAICLKHATVFDGPLGVCTSDEHCQAAGNPAYTWRCLRSPLWEEGGYCYGDVAFCSDWTLL